MNKEENAYKTELGKTIKFLSLFFDKIILNSSFITTFAFLTSIMIFFSRGYLDFQNVFWDKKEITVQITGRVLDTNNSRVLPNATVLLQDYDIVAKTDSIGRFNLRFSTIQNKQIKIFFLKEGYMVQNIEVFPNKDNDNIVLNTALKKPVTIEKKIIDNGN